MKRVQVWVAATAGASLLAWFVWDAGPRAIAHAIWNMGPAAAWVWIPYGFVYAFDTLGWRQAFRPNDNIPPFRRLAAIRLAGEAVNNTIPSAYVGGEPVKAWFLHREGTSKIAAASSVVIAKTTMTLAQVAFIVLGNVAALWALPSGHPALPAFAITTVLAVGVGGLLWALQTHGFAAVTQAVFSGLRIGRRFFERHREALGELDQRVRTFVREHRSRYAASVVWHLLGWLAGAAEVWALAHLLQIPVTVPEAVAIEAFAHVAKALGFFIPGSLGLQESGILLLFATFGLPRAEGVAYALLRRGREVLFVLLGVGLGWHLRRQKPGSPRVPLSPDPAGE